MGNQKDNQSKSENHFQKDKGFRKEKGNQKRRKTGSKPALRPGTRGYSILLGILLYLSIYYLFMLLAIAPKNPEVALDGLMVIGLFPLLAVVMLFFQIRYWVRTGSGPDLKGKTAGFFRWFYSFLFPVKTGFFPIETPSQPAQKMTADFRDSLSAMYREHLEPSQVTQMYGNLLQLHRQRLMSLGLQLQTSFRAMSVKGLQDAAVYTIPDGKLNHISVREHLKVKRKIVCGSRSVYTLQGNADSVCDFVGARNGGGEAAGARFLCPNCGAVSTMTELVKGCPYCGTAFLMEELKDRVCSFSTSPSPEMDESYFHLKMNQIINRIAFAFTLLEFFFGFIPMMYEVFIRDHAGIEEAPIALILGVSSLVLSLVMTFAFNWILTLPIRAVAHRIYQKRREKKSLDHQVMVRNRKMFEKVHAQDPDFSMESFFSNVRNKIAAIHYSGKFEQADVFSTVDLASAIGEYADVAECIWGPMELIEYERGTTYRTAVVETRLTLLRWDGGQIRSAEEKLRLKLMRYSEESRKSPFGVHLPTCSKCGASVNLLLGNQCPHCGSELDFMHLDWCIASYERSE